MNSPKPPPAATPDATPDATPTDYVDIAQALMQDGTTILAAIDAAGISLRKPSALLAFQILAVLVAKTLGADPRANYDNLLTLVEGMNLAPLETWIKDIIR